MCGIFFYSEKNKYIKKKILTKIIKFSEKRGLDNLGVCFKNSDIEILKNNILEEKIYNSKRFKNIILKKNNFAFGQCRLVTDGPRFKQEYNQPIITSKFIGTHNGIILDYSKNEYSENISSENDTRNFYQDLTKTYFENPSEIENFIKNKKVIINIIFFSLEDN